MMKIGDLVVDTKKNVSATVVNVIEGGLYDVYLLSIDEESEHYLQSSDNLIEYDKYYFDK